MEPTNLTLENNNPNESFDFKYVSACGSWCNHLLFLQILNYHIWVITNYNNKMD